MQTQQTIKLFGTVSNSGGWATFLQRISIVRVTNGRH